MPDNSRIEDLRKRYHENPRRFFAPLANEYRKAGLLDRALLLCQKHVTEQPENMNGLVVYGQTLFEMEQPEAARAPFEQALQLDPENLIALRHLGDIARLLGEVATAKGWYERVLELDRRNDEVLELLEQLGGGDANAGAAPAPRPSTTAAGLVSVAPTVSVSGGGDFGFVELDAPPKPPVGKGGTAVIDAQSLANRDRAEAQSAAAASASAADQSAVPTVEIPQVRPSKRASLLDISFDFGETAEPAPALGGAEAPAPVAETASFGFAAGAPIDPSAAETLLMHPAAGAVDGMASAGSDALIVETTGDVAPLGLEPTIAEPAPLPEAAAPSSDFELADFSAEVSPLAGLEATEFSSEPVTPMAEFEPDSVSMSMPSIRPLADLDRPDVTLDDVAPIAGLDAAMAVPPIGEPAGLDGLADLPLLDDAAAPLAAEMDAPAAEQPSARPRPRMTKADLASLPLLADFGLEDDALANASASATVPSPEATTVRSPEATTVPAPDATPEPAARASKAPATFVTETMAALYVKQGLFANAIDVYHQLVAASPGDAGLRAKLTELERMAGQATAAARPAAADEMPEFDTPLDAGEPVPAPANAAMDGVSFGGIGLRGQGAATPIVTPAVPAGPTARDFFGGFARRAAVVAVAAASPMAAVAAARASAERAAEVVAEVAVEAAASAASGWPLDAIFGAANEVRDLHAAETLAGVGTFTGPDGGTGIGQLFAAEAQPPRRSVPRASETLKFDQFFQKPGTASAEPVAADAAPGDDDLDQFQDWLKGLKQ